MNTSPPAHAVLLIRLLLLSGAGLCALFVMIGATARWSAIWYFLPGGGGGIEVTAFFTRLDADRILGAVLGLTAVIIVLRSMPDPQRMSSVRAALLLAAFLVVAGYGWYNWSEIAKASPTTQFGELTVNVDLNAAVKVMTVAALAGAAISLVLLFVSWLPPGLGEDNDQFDAGLAPALREAALFLVAISALFVLVGSIDRWSYVSVLEMGDHGELVPTGRRYLDQFPRQEGERIFILIVGLGLGMFGAVRLLLGRRGEFWLSLATLVPFAVIAALGLYYWYDIATANVTERYQETVVITVKPGVAVVAVSSAAGAALSVILLALALRPRAEASP